MKSFPITAEVRAELDELNSALWAHLNGSRLERGVVARLAHLTSAVRHFDSYGREGSCPSVLHHGPGHQSRAECELEIDHAGHHRGRVSGAVAEWDGLVAFTGYFDDLPEIGPD